MKARRWSSIVPFALVGGIGAFAATTAGLTVEDADFTSLTWITLATAVLASVLNAIMAAIASTKGDELLARAIGEQKELTDMLSTRAQEAERLANELSERVRVATEDRSRTSGSLSLLAAALREILMAHPDRREYLLGQFQMRLLTLLGTTLEGPGGILLAPARVVFLERTEERGLLLRKGSLSWGHNWDVMWDVAVSTDEKKIAKDIMFHLPPFKEGYLVPDVQQRKESGEQLWLSPPEDSVSSYCRLGVCTERIAWGILCIDTWKRQKNMSRSDMAVGKAFAEILSVALAAVRMDPEK